MSSEQMLLFFQIAVLAVFAIFVGYEMYRRKQAGEDPISVIGSWSDLLLFVSEYIETIVHGVEQSPATRDLEGSKKKELVLGKVKSFLSDLGIVIDDDFVDDMIEAAVWAMNAAIKKII